MIAPRNRPLQLNLLLLPDRIEDVKGGSLIGRQWCEVQLLWAEFLRLRRRLDHGEDLAPIDWDRLQTLVDHADMGDDDVTHELQLMRRD